VARRKNLLSDSTNDYLQCRDFGHAWRWITDFVPFKSEGKVVAMTRTLECLRCGSTRYDEYSVPSMTKIRTLYAYSEGYRLVGHKGHVPISEVRMEIINRIKKKEW
jgi:hypothetical protein